MSGRAAVRSAAVAALGAMVQIGCGSGQAVQSVDPSRVQPAPPGSVQSAHVPAGREVLVRLEQALDTRTSHAGQPFTAAVVFPIVATNGTTLIQAGATLHGEVTEVSGDPPRLMLRPKALETTHGLVSVDAVIRSTEKTLYATDATTFHADVGRHGTALVPRVESPGRPATGASQVHGYEGPSPGRALRLPAGAEMRLLLTRPIVAEAAVPVLPE